MALVLRIKFPADYPLIYKTLRIDSKLSVREAIQFVGETLHVPAPDTIGLYVPQEELWLNDNECLEVYEVLHDAEEVEFKDKFATAPAATKEKASGGGDDGGGCCSIS